MGTKLNPGAFDCYNSAAPDEEMFVLLARDPRAPFLVSIWAQAKLGDAEACFRILEAMLDRVPWGAEINMPKISEAMNCSQRMFEQQRQRGMPVAGQLSPFIPSGLPSAAKVRAAPNDTGVQSIREPEEDLCPWVYKSTRCGYVGELMSCTKTSSACMAHNNFEHFGGTLRKCD